MKYIWIDAQRDHYGVNRLCRAQDISRTGYCQWQDRAPSARARANAIWDVNVRQIHVGSGATYGRPRIVQAPRRQGLPVGSERVRQNLRMRDLRPVYKRALSGDDGLVAPFARGAQHTGSTLRSLATESYQGG